MDDAKDAGAREHLEDSLNRFDEASIFTIHGFCRKFLSEFAFESRVSMDMEVGDEKEILHEVVMDWIRRELPRLDGGIRKALLKDGADKLCETISMVAGKFMPEDRLVNPFDECRAELDKVIPDIKNEAKAVKDALEGILKTGKIPGKNAHALNERLQWFACIKKAAGGATLSPGEIPVDYALTGTNISMLEAASPELLMMCRKLKRCGCRAAPEKRVLEKAILACRDELYKRLGSSGVQTYTDMILQVHCRVTQKDSPLRDALRERFRFGLIDEFQDTNRRQWEIFRSIFIDGNLTHPLKRILWVAGDPKQSIFSFQGSDVQVSLDALETFRSAGSEGVTLDTNRRSSDDIVASCNTLFQTAGWFTPPYRPVKPCGIPRFTVAKRAKSAVKSHWMVCDVSATDKNWLKKKKVREWTVGWINYLLRGDGGGPCIEIPDGKTGAMRPLRESDICVLAEKNKECDPIMSGLRVLGIRVSKEGETGLFGSDECLQMICMLEAIAAPADETGRRKALLTFFFALSPADLLSLSDPDSTAVKEIDRLFDGWRRHAQAGRYSRMMESLFEKTGVIERLARLHGGTRSISALRQIRGYALKALLEEHRTLAELAMHLRSLHAGDKKEKEEEETFHRESSRSAVQFMTMHKGKGLEFPVVFLPTGCGQRYKGEDFLSVRVNGNTQFCLDKEYAGLKDLDAAAYKDERQRLWYVGITRASQMLFTVRWGALNRGADSSSGLFLEKAFSDKTLEEMRVQVDREAKAPPVGNKVSVGAETAAPPLTAAPIGSAGIREAGLHLRGRRQTSYSALAHGEKATLYQPEKLRTREDDEQEAAVETEGAAEKPILPRGRHTGEALHQVLEELDFGLAAACRDPETLLDANGGAVREKIEKALKRNRLWGGDGGARAGEAARILWNSLRTEIPDPAAPGTTFRLCDIPASDRMSEVEYHFTFARDGAVFPERAMADGTVLGYMDLAFRRDGRFYVLDWKSNTLPSYGGDNCNRAMEENRYTLQAALYSMALEKALSGFPSCGPGAKVAGAIFMFLRGTREGKQDGVWTTDREGIERALKTEAGQNAISVLLARETEAGE
jgi:exodeoxyribonuclease V beta subunit